MLKKRVLIGIIAGLAVFLAVSAFFLAKFDIWKLWEDEGSCFDYLYTDLNGDSSGVRIYCWTDKYDDDRENAGGHYIFLPSCAVLKDTHLYFTEADQLVLTDPDSGEIVRIKDNGSLKKVNVDTDYTADFYEHGELIESGRLTFMQAENLPTVFINTNSRTMDNINADKNLRETGQVMIYKSDGSVEYADEFEYLKGHGNTSWQIEKKTYQIRFSSAASIFGMKASDKWILQSNGMDHSYIRNSVVFGMAKAMGMRAVPETTYVELYFNGNYNGLYQIESKAAVEKNRLDLTELDMENNQVNSAMLEMYDLETVSGNDGSERVGLKFTSPDDISGGYLLERDYGEKYGSAVSKFTTVSGESYVVKYPEYASIDEVNYIADKFQEIEDAVKDKNSNLSELIDIRSFADKYLLEEFSRNDASGSTSSYFYKDSDRIDSLVYAGPPWDYDKTFGENSAKIMKQTNTLNFLTSHAGRTLLFFDLYQNSAEFLETVKSDYAENFRPYLEELIRDGGVIDELAEIVASDHEMDAERWGFGRSLPMQWIKEIKDYIKERMEFTDKIWIDNEDIHLLYFPRDKESHSLYIGICDGDSLEYMPYDYVSRGNEEYWYDADTGEIIDENTPITRDMTIIAKEKDE